jgi:glycosyltransferase involved in cell wall biosynthesis
VVRVGIEVPSQGESWLGGMAAIANLVNALLALDTPRVEPVLIAGIRTPGTLLDAMGPVHILRTGLIDTSHWSSWVGRATRRGLGRNLPLEHWLKHHGIEVYSHCSPLGRFARVPTIGHIADFGYRHFPELYSPATLSRIDSGMARVCNEYDLLLLSSRAAEQDYRSFFPSATATSAILNIVPSNIPEPSSTKQDLFRKYGLADRYIYSPNQFWVHKNHLRLIDALAIAKQARHDLHVVCTGRTSDERRPGHFDSVMEHAVQRGVADRFHVLGIIPYADAMDLMRHSAAVLNASLFEGWGISVTEAKMLGKTIVLSDIAPFREQAPARALYFDPEDAEAMAAQLIAAFESYSEEEDQGHAAREKKRWPELINTYARAYEEIVLTAVAKAGR